MMTKDELEAIRQRVKNATIGPWAFEKGDRSRGDRRSAVICNFNHDHGEWYIHGDISNIEDAEFIAHARQDIPALLDHIAELASDIARMCPIADRPVIESLLAEKDHMAEEISDLQRKIDLYEAYAQEYDYYAILNEMGDEDARRELTAQAPVEKTAQELRDEIVEQAKADVERLSNRYQRKNYCGTSVEFVVNHEKRTVVALLKGVNTGIVYTKGIAKATPDDCFNEHIGKAIALHRALGIELPDEYPNAPQPTEVRVGDVVAYRGVYKTTEYVTVVADDQPTGGGRAALTSMAVKHAKIIDDSRTEAI